ncbi:unnamed protein product [Adineta steineri]|uniref:Uncharacterized protein n=1 Tax=Adineta steineri TaxID=433720 RepID=A0A814PD20_9BILA|nr:unnamed protein product [Adineta steineri]CAF1106242.1 unnamed protein product [Adineta steineri]CAF1208925.1 unnamed protein product [Adineta steineri]
MSAEQSLKNSFTYFGYLAMLEGFALLIFPNLATKLLFLLPLQSPQAEQYARVAGLGLMVIGYYYYIAGKNTLIPFFRELLLIFTVLDFSSLETSFVIFGIQDLLTGLYSYVHLKAFDTEQAKTRK